MGDQSSILLASLAHYGQIFFWMSILSYFYYGFTLMVIAKKTNTPNAALAWIPIANIFLMTSIGRRPAWWAIIVLLVPIVNIIFAVMLWMAIAEARGKSPWLGGLIIVPVIGLFVPLALAMGQATTPGAVSAALPVCSACGQTGEAGETFCGHCGGPMAAPAPGVAGQPASPSPLAGRAFALLAAVITAIIGIAWSTFMRSVAYSAPNRTAPAMPARLAGTLKEFPVDTNMSSPTHPTQVSMVDLTKPKANIDMSTLPRGVTTDTLTQHATAMTSARYTSGATKSAPQTASASSSATGTISPALPKDSTYVNVLNAAGPGPGDGKAIATSVESGTGGTETGVSVTSSKGATYNGWKIKDSTGETIVLVKDGAPIIIIIYAPDPAQDGKAEQLATDIGNGNGLADDPAATASVFTLPASSLPDGLTLTSERSMTPEQMGINPSDLQAGSGATAQEQQQLASVRALLPEQMTAADYTDSSGKPWHAFVAQYADTRGALNAWYAGRVLLGSQMTSTTVKGGTALYMDNKDDGSRIMAYQQGPYVVLLNSPASAPVQDLAALGDAFQI